MTEKPNYLGLVFAVVFFASRIGLDFLATEIKTKFPEYHAIYSVVEVGKWLWAFVVLTFFIGKIIARRKARIKNRLEK